MKRFILTCAILSVPVLLVAQSARPTSRFQWTITDTPLTKVQAFQWDLELDGVVQIVVATCSGTAAPFTCSTPIPAITPGQHTARIRAAELITGEPRLEGPWSDPLTFTMRATPAKPGNFVIVQ